MVEGSASTSASTLFFFLNAISILNFKNAFDGVQNEYLMEYLDKIGSVRNDTIVKIKKNTAIGNRHKEKCG